MDSSILTTVEELFAAQQSGEGVRIFDLRFALPGPSFDRDYGREVYQGGHIPDAIYVDLERELSGTITPSTGRHPLPEPEAFLDALQGWGVSPEQKVVIYDDCHGFIAARFWWMLYYWVGHRKTALLDGGYAAWRKAGFGVDTIAATLTPTTHRYAIRKDTLLTTAQIQGSLTNKDNWLLVDARATPRYRGDMENVDPVAGHIPGAINLPCMQNTDEAGFFLTQNSLRERFTPLVDRAGDPSAVVHSCGSGVTACHNIFAMTYAGYPGARLYAGSWSEWIRDPGNPVATGDLP